MRYIASHVLVLDWWLFCYGPAVIMGIGLFLFLKRCSYAEKTKIFYAAALWILLGFIRLHHELFARSSHFHFSAVFWICVAQLMLFWQNPALALFFLGGISNAAAALMNGGRMPVFGLSEISGLHQPMTMTTAVPWLCDWIMTPHEYYILSVGDLLIILGAVMMLTHELERIRLKSVKQR